MKDDFLLKTIADFKFWFTVKENRSDAPSIEQWLQLMVEGLNEKKDAEITRLKTQIHEFKRYEQLNRLNK